MEGLSNFDRQVTSSRISSSASYFHNCQTNTVMISNHVSCVKIESTLTATVCIMMVIGGRLVQFPACRQIGIIDQFFSVYNIGRTDTNMEESFGLGTCQSCQVFFQNTGPGMDLYLKVKVT